MGLIMKPIRIKEGYYFLLPKKIADYYKIDHRTRFMMTISFRGKKIIKYAVVVPKKKKSRRRKNR